MTRDEIALELGRLAQVLDHRVEIWRTVIDEHGNELRRIYRGSFQRDPRTSEKHSPGG